MSALLRLLSSVAIAGLLASTASASPSHLVALRARDSDLLNFNPVGVELSPLAHAPVKRISNAERLARGLPLNKPHRRSAGQLRARTSPTPTSDAVSVPTPEPSSAVPSSVVSDPSSSAVPSSVIPPPASSSVVPSSDVPAPPSSSAAPPAATCTPVSGIISVSGGSNGYVGAVANSFGEYGITSDVNNALKVAYQQCNGDTAYTPRSFTSSNGFSNFPVIAATLGFASTSNNLGPGLFNYAYITGVGSEVPAGSPAQTQPNSFSAAAGVPKDSETAIWIVNAATGAITPRWVNTDGSAFTPTVLYVPSSDALAFAGDIGAFTSNFGSGNVVSLTFVQPSPIVQTMSVY